MFNTALVALDLSPAEEPILECLPDLMSWGVKKVILTHVIQVSYHQFSGYGHEDEYRAWLERLAQPLRANGLEVEVSVRSSGVPADEILQAAHEHGADLVVIGSRGRNLISKFFLGSVARAVIQKTNLPLLLEWVEPTAAGTQQKCAAVCTHTLRHVLLATDLSASAAAAENATIHLAAQAEQVDCLYVKETSGSAATSLSTSHAQEALNKLVQRITATGSQASSVVLQGKASSVISEHAGRLKISLIVVGKRGQNPLASLVIGSTVANLCEIAGRPVLMMP